MDALPAAGPGWVTELLYRTLGTLDRLLVRAGVPYTANGGTLLGAVRHQGVIPWDVDADIAVRLSDLPRIFALEEALHTEGLATFQKPNHMVKVFAREGRVTGLGWRYPAIDIWPMVMVDGRWAPSYLPSRLYWAAEWLEAESFSALIRRPFGATDISTVPDAIAERYLARTYGHRWNTRYVDYQHGLPDPFHRRLRAPRADGSPGLRRAPGLQLHEIDEGLIVYQQDPPRVHHLNHSAALVFALCTGEATIDDIVAHVQRGYALEAPPVVEVNSCIERLCREEVLVVD